MKFHSSFYFAGIVELSSLLSQESLLSLQAWPSVAREVIQARNLIDKQYDIYYKYKYLYM